MASQARPRTAAEQARLELQRPARSEAEREARAVGRKHSGDSRAALAEIAAALGHAGGRVVPTASGARWFGMCACGWVCRHTDRTEAEATGALLHHVTLAVRAWHRTGLPLSAAKQARDTSRKPPHYDAWMQACGGAEEVARRDTQASKDDVPRSVRAVG